jgi:hypothetical protein
VSHDSGEHLAWVGAERHTHPDFATATPASVLRLDRSFAIATPVRHHRDVLGVAVVVVALGSQAQPVTVPEMWDAWCARCHAADGSGRVAEPTVTVEPMDFTACQVTTAEPDADWELAIAHGGPAVGLSSEMPAFGDAVNAETIQGFVRHMRGFCKETGWPSGNLNFPRPIFTEKAFPENEFVLLPVISHRRPEAAVTGETSKEGLTDLRFTAVFERRFGKRAMWEVAMPVTSFESIGRGRESGVGDVEVAAKYVIVTSARTPRILTGGNGSGAVHRKCVAGSGKWNHGLGAVSRIRRSGPRHLRADTGKGRAPRGFDEGRSRVRLPDLRRSRLVANARYVDLRRRAERRERRSGNYAPVAQGLDEDCRAWRLDRREGPDHGTP